MKTQATLNHDSPDLARKSITSRSALDSHLSFTESNPLYHDLYSPDISSDGFPSLDSKTGFYPEQLSDAPVMRPSHTPGWYSDASSQEGDAIQRNCHAKVRGSSSVLAKRRLLQHQSLEESQSVLEFGAFHCSQSSLCGTSDQEADDGCGSLEAGAQYCVDTEGSPGGSLRSEGCEYTHVKKLLGLVRTEELKNIKCLDDDDSSQGSAQQCELSTGGDLSPKWSSLSSLVTGE